MDRIKSAILFLFFSIFMFFPKFIIEFSGMVILSIYLILASIFAALFLLATILFIILLEISERIGRLW